MDYFITGYSSCPIERSILLLILLTCHHGLSTSCLSECQNISATVNQILLDYDKNFRPSFEGPAVHIYVTLFVAAFGEFDAQESVYDINLYIRQTWTDSRLAFASNSSRKISLKPSFLENIWVPDTTFVNVQKALLHLVTTPNQLVHLWSDGTVLTSTRVTAKVYCQMKLLKFPFDEQTCDLVFGSYGYDKSEIDYTWKYKEKAENIKFGEHAKIKQFKIQDFDILRKEKDFGETGIFTKLSLEFSLKREIGFYIINVYFPATLLVGLSWVSFWLRRDQTPARVALGITTALTLMTLITGTHSYTPKVPYIRAIDWFLLICFVCVTGALLEYAAVHYFDKQDAMDPKSWRKYTIKDFDKATLSTPTHQKTAFDEFHAPDSVANDRNWQPNCIKRMKKVMFQNVSSIDRISRWVFPLFFIALNCVYWILYLK